MVLLRDQATELAEVDERGDIKLKEAMRQYKQREKMSPEEAQDAPKV